MEELLEEFDEMSVDEFIQRVANMNKLEIIEVTLDDS